MWTAALPTLNSTSTSSRLVTLAQQPKSEEQSLVPLQTRVPPSLDLDKRRTSLLLSDPRYQQSIIIPRKATTDLFAPGSV